MLRLKMHPANSSKSAGGAKLPVLLRDLTNREDSGVGGYLRFIEEPDGKGIRGALCIDFGVSGILTGVIEWNLL